MAFSASGFIVATSVGVRAQLRATTSNDIRFLYALLPRPAAGFKRTHCWLRSLLAAPRTLLAGGQRASPRLCGLGVLGAAGAVVWRSPRSRVNRGAGARRAWIEPHRAAVHGGWLGKLSFPGAA